MDVIDINQNFWGRSLAVSTYRMFAAAKHACNERGTDDDGIEIEIEARLGNQAAREQTRRFSPGSPEKLFNEIKKHFKPTNEIETYDVTFTESRVRVSVQVLPGGQVGVNQVIHKMKQNNFRNADALLRGKTSHDLRVSLMVEKKLPEQLYTRECQVALQWVRNLLNPTSVPDPLARLNYIATGQPCSISASVGDDFSIIETSNRIESEWLSKLEWTLLRPRAVQDLSKRHMEWNDSLNLSDDTHVVIGNLPGIFVTESGKEVHASAFEFHIKLGVGYLNPTKTPSSVIEDVHVRHKRRWRISFPKEKTLASLDLTETREGNTHSALLSSEIKHEIEMERALNVSEAKQIDPVSETEKFLKSITSVLFQTSLGYPDERVKSMWRSESIPRLALDPPEQFASRARLAEEDAVPRKRPNISDTQNVGGTSADAENFYNSLERNREDRSKSLIYHMRCLNNFVKSTLLGKYMKQTKDARILELSCGKGADFGKMQKCTRSIARYVGTDIAKTSLEQAVSRLQQQKPSNNRTAIKLISADLSKTDISKSDWGVDIELDVWENGSWTSTKNVLIENERFSFVSMQFALHYMFSSREITERFFYGVSQRMEEGAVFMITTVDADALVSALLDSKQRTTVEFWDEKKRLTCKIDFPESTYNRLFSPKINDNEDWFGLEYHFKLFDGETAPSEKAVDAPEWMVPTRTLNDLFERNNLRVIEEYQFGDFVNRQLEFSEQEDLWRNMSVPNRQGTISDVEWAISNLYKVLVLRKTTNESEENNNRFLQVLGQLSSTIPGWNELSSAERADLIQKHMSS